MKNWMNTLLLSTNFVLYLVVIAVWITIPNSTTLNLIITMITFSMSLVLAFMNRLKLAKYYVSEQFQKFSSAFTSVMIILCILGLVNYLSFKHPKQIDFSERSLNSLTDQSVKVIKSVDDKITFKIFARKNNSVSIKSLIDLYKFENSNVKVELIDVDVRPDLVKINSITQSPTVVIEKGQKREAIIRMRELEITNGIVKVTREKNPIIYYLTGHGEARLKDQSGDGLTFFSSLVTSSSYDFKELNLLEVDSIPEDADLVMLWGPKDGLSQKNILILDKYMKNDGRLIISINPEFNTPRLQVLRDWLTSWGIRINDDLVVDKVSFVNGSNGTIPLIKKFSSDHAITDQLKSQLFLPLASSVEFSDSPIHLGQMVELIKSSNGSWGETNSLEFISKSLEFTPGKDVQGPLNLMGVWSSKEGDSKIVALGNSTLVTNAYKNYTGNFLIVLNSISWLANEGRMISFNQPLLADQPVFISGPQQGAIFYFSVVITPLLLASLALFSFFRRRRL